MRAAGGHGQSTVALLVPAKLFLVSRRCANNARGVDTHLTWTLVLSWPCVHVQLAAAVVTEAQGTPLEPVVNGVVRTVGDALGLGASSLSAPSPAGAAIFNTNAGPAVAPAASSSATIFDTSAPPAVAPVTAPVRAPASAPLLAPAPAPAARAPAVNRAAVPVFASPNDAGAVGGRRLLRA